MSDPTLEDAHTQALAYCTERIGFYQGVGVRNYTRWKIIGSAVIVLGAAGTALSAMPATNHYYWVTGFRIASVAGTTILSGIVTFWSFQKEGVRQMVTADLLRGELIKFETQAAPPTTPPPRSATSSTLSGKSLLQRTRPSPPPCSASAAHR